MDQENPLLFLELIPGHRLTARQKKLQAVISWAVQGLSPIYRFRRIPTHIADLKQNDRSTIAIWCSNNETLLSLNDHGSMGVKHCNVAIDQMKVAIYGFSDAAIAETVSFVCSLTFSEDPSSLRIGSGDGRSNFNYATIALAPLLDANPPRNLDLQITNLTIEQSRDLATRPYPLNLNLNLKEFCFSFQDGGNAFVNALEHRTTPFGSLSMTLGNNVTPPGIHHNNVLRLFQMEKFDRLYVSNPDRDCVLPLLAAKVNGLECYIHAKDIAPSDFDSLNIVAKDLNVKWNLSHAGNWSDILIAFFHRLATLCHVEKLAFSAANWVAIHVFGHDAVAPVAAALVRTIHSNPALQHLELSHVPTIGLDWTSHMQSIFQSLEEHPSIRTLIVSEVIPFRDTRTDEEREEYFSWLEHLLSRNHYLTVLDTSGQRVTNGSNIDKIYRDRYYHLAATKSAYQHFRHTVHLLSILHTDALCQFMENVDPGGGVASQSVLESEAQLPAPNSPTVFLKRKLTMQPSGDEAKKVRNES
ncbi:hypothetical protein FisN_10Hh382 [Fistulifera solaris]|uniref:Uncharacterized protein n=1 Tax=Fistulifera solaris TaxID=1519565 RepID=A0A1Z5JR14_FISSO|nr:hypothetical protein FisN_10Hh382 [Fistulifera solaris]|eukprot:GAX16389.1 hypothetical protein FisN_10Hh382 [Fistulifera solaris]